MIAHMIALLTIVVCWVMSVSAYADAPDGDALKAMLGWKGDVKVLETTTFLATPADQVWLIRTTSPDGMSGADGHSQLVLYRPATKKAVRLAGDCRVKTVLDLDTDGRQEVVLDCGGMGQGIMVGRYAVVHVVDDGLKKLHEGAEYEIDTGSGRPNPTSTEVRWMWGDVDGDDVLDLTQEVVTKTGTNAERGARKVWVFKKGVFKVK